MYFYKQCYSTASVFTHCGDTSTFLCSKVVEGLGDQPDQSHQSQERKGQYWHPPAAPKPTPCSRQTVPQVNPKNPKTPKKPDLRLLHLSRSKITCPPARAQESKRPQIMTRSKFSPLSPLKNLKFCWLSCLLTGGWDWTERRCWCCRRRIKNQGGNSHSRSCHDRRNRRNHRNRKNAAPKPTPCSRQTGYLK